MENKKHYFSMQKIKSYSEFINESTNLNADLLNDIEKEICNYINRNPNFHIEWGRLQNDEWDKDTKPYFIYSLKQFRNKWNTCLDKEKVKYALMRWFRHWCAKCDENILCDEYAEPNPDIYDKEWDIQFKNLDIVGDIKFDVKSTRVFKDLIDKTDYYKKNPEELIKLYYKDQTKESRYGHQNRLFIIHIPSNNRTETMVRCDFNKKREIVKEYFESIKTGEHKPYNIEIDGYKVISDIIFVD